MKNAERCAQVHSSVTSGDSRRRMLPGRLPVAGRCRLQRIALLAIMPLAARPAAGNTPVPFVHAASNGPVFTVTTNGLVAIRLGDREIARGEWRAWNAESHFGMGTGAVAIGETTARTIEVLAADRVRVRHAHPDVVVIYDYAFAGEDVTIRARVENNHPTQPLPVVGFSGLQFTWPAPPRGMLPCTHVSWLRAHPGVSFHPGEIKIGGTYGAAGDLGIGTSPAHADLLRTLTMWDFADWTPPEASRTSRENSPSRNLQYFVNASVPPEGARTFGLWVRISRNPEWHHLLEPYKDWFRATLGPVRYAPDHRPLLQMCVNKSVQYITPRNPYGYHDGWARLDTAEGTAEFCDKLVPLLKAVNGQGVIIWGQQGTEPRGAEYRPDFDVLPPETATNWVTLQSRFREAGLKLGVATRPDSIPTRASWTHDTLVTLDPDDADHLEMLWRRFRNMMDKGCRLFYLDCFGMRVEDVAIMRFLRERMGPDVQTYSEMHCDAILPFTGLYMEAVYQGGTTPEDARFDIMWLGPGQWEMLRWLADDRISVAARPRTENAPAALPAGFHYRWMLERHLTPLEQPWALQPGAAVLRDLLPQWLDARGQWLK